MAAPRVDHFRTHARIPVSTELSVSPVGATYELPAQLVDLGLGGTCFELGEAFEIGQRLRLEFELDAMPTASLVTAALNGGYENRPWQLESVTGAGGGGQIGFASAQVVRGLWFVQVGKL